MNTRRDVFQAIADPTRREIISLLAPKTMNLNAVAAHFEISRPAISKHIKILTECGIVMIRREGRERYCEVQINRLDEVTEWLQHMKDFWAGKLDALGALLEEEARSKTKAQRRRLRGK